MSRAADWTESILIDDFPDDAQFIESGNANHVIVTWQIDDENGQKRRNAPFVIIVDQAIVDRWDASNECWQADIEKRVREIIAERRAAYDERGPVAVPQAFAVHLEEGAL